MPHEHINSSIGAVDERGNEIINRERVVVIWNRPGTDHAYDTPDGGYVQIMSEWPGSAARFPSPQMIEIDTTAPHAYHPEDDSSDCRWCGRTESDGPHGIINPALPHLFRADLKAAANAGISLTSDTYRHVCVHCGLSRSAGPHDTIDPERGVAHPDPRPAPRGPGTGNPTIPHFYGTRTASSDPDPDSDPCDFCGLGKHDSDAAHLVRRQPQIVRTEGEPTWTEPCTGFAVTYTRDDINRLIKMLRKARDQAYGEDA